MNTSEVYSKLAEKLGYTGSGRFLRIMEKMISPKEGELLLALPAETAELAKKAGLDEETVNNMLSEFLQRGLAVHTRKGIQLVRDIIQLHDAALSSAEKFVDQELLDLWKEFYEAEFCQDLGEKWKGLEQPFLNVIPARKALQRSSQISPSDVLPEENLEEIIRKAELIAVVPCTCRRTLRRCDAPLEICIQFDRAAEYAINRGAGRELSKEEALSVADLAEEAGLVHTMLPGERLVLMCNCCADCCVVFDPAIKYGILDKAVLRSRYQATVDQDLCNGCQDCVERCPSGAIEMEKVPPHKKLKAVVASEICLGCGVCAVGCTQEAIAMELARP